MTFDAVFSWVPRTAGTSIWQRLCGAAKRRDELSPGMHLLTLRSGVRVLVTGHWPLAMLIGDGRLSAERYAAAFTFSVVRHPASRFESLFRYWKAKGCRLSAGAFVDGVISGRPCPCAMKRYGGLSHAARQTDLLCDASGAVLPRVVLRYENLATDWPGVAAEIGFQPRPLGRYNVGLNRGDSPFSRATVRRIVRHYSKDFQTFGYST